MLTSEQIGKIDREKLLALLKAVWQVAQVVLPFVLPFVTKDEPTQ